MVYHERRFAKTHWACLPVILATGIRQKINQKFKVLDYKAS